MLSTTRKNRWTQSLVCIIEKKKSNRSQYFCVVCDAMPEYPINTFCPCILPDLHTIMSIMSLGVSWFLVFDIFFLTKSFRVSTARRGRVEQIRNLDPITGHRLRTSEGQERRGGHPYTLLVQRIITVYCRKTATTTTTLL